MKKEYEQQLYLDGYDLKVEVGTPSVEDIVFFKSLEQLCIYFFGWEGEDLPFKVKIYVRE